MMIFLKTEDEIRKMRDAGRIVAQVLNFLEGLIAPGVTTAYLNGKAEELIRAAGGEPAFLGYRGFPGSICTSVNEELVHGVPGRRKLKEGDIISIDCGVRYRGYYGDAAETFSVGRISRTTKRLIDVTRGSFEIAMSQMRKGNHLSDISYAVQSFVESNGFSVVRNYVGHGIGCRMHEDPEIPNFGEPGMGPRLREGMVFALEPMVNVGTWEVEVLRDKWTVVTKDRTLCAHYEHTVALTSNGPEILTLL